MEIFKISYILIVESINQFEGAPKNEPKKKKVLGSKDDYGYSVSLREKLYHHGINFKCYIMRGSEFFTIRW
jgi:hypothetical protein